MNLYKHITKPKREFIEAIQISIVYKYWTRVFPKNYINYARINYTKRSEYFKNNPGTMTANSYFITKSTTLY